MIVVSNDFKTAMKQPIKELQAFIDYEDLSIRDEDDLISYKISGDGGLCKTVMRKIEIKHLGSHNLLGKWVNAGFSVKLPSGAFEPLNYGSFMVTEVTTSKDTDTTSVVGYDKMINAMIPYVPLNIEYPVDLLTYTQKLCEACDLELGNNIFGYNLWDISKQKGLNNIVYDNETGIYTAEDNDTKTTVEYKLQQYDATTYIENTVVLEEITNTGIYTFTTTRVENATNIRLANHGNSREFSIFYPIPNSIAVGDTFTVMFEVVDNTVGGSQFKNVMLYKGDSVLSYRPYNPINEWQVTQELWENIDGITYRDIFTQIAQATGSTCIIHDDKVYFKPLTDTNESLTYDNMFKLKLEDKYGEINSVVLGRDPVVGEDVFIKDDNSIAENGLTEYRISNNEIVDKDRENAIKPIYDALYGIYYYPFEATTEGLGWYEIGDNFNIVTDTGNVYNTSLFNFSITMDGSLKETLKTVAESKTQTQYQYATSISKRVKNAEIIVNKQEGNIQSLITDVYEGDGVVNQKFTKVYQDIDKIINSVQNSGGNNLLINSVMFDYDNNEMPNGWEVEGDGSLTIGSNTESVSQHGFTLSGVKVSQTIPVMIFDSENPVYYSFSTKIRKGSAGSCYVKVYNTNEEHIIPLGVGLGVGQEAYYNEFEIVKLEPKDNYYTIEFYGSADSDTTFTDNMFSVGEYKSQWTQANGEVMNTNVVINKDGITVKNLDDEGNQTGDYTVVSTVEFAGYSYVNGTKTKVFSLNKDITRVSKLFAENEITMPPIKIVPITEGDLQGWAFVPTTEV